MRAPRSYYWNTVCLNVLFILLIPIVLTAIFKESMIAFIMYLLIYSSIEWIIDAYNYEVFDPARPWLLLFTTILFNLLLIYGVSLIIQVFFVGGLQAIAILMTLWILGMSKVEILIDDKLMKESD